MHNRNRATLAIAAVAIIAAVAGCATGMRGEEDASARAIAVMKSSFEPRGQAKLDRIDQDETQRVCSQYHGAMPVPHDVAARVVKLNEATLKYPADGQYMGDWKAGEKIAQSGRGMQYTDDPKKANGGNCFACHQLTPQEVSYGTIGPSLLGFGKKRGFTAEMQKYVYGKVYNSEAFAACSNMPRFGYHGILTEAQIKDVVALLLDPKSPVNQ